MDSNLKELAEKLKEVRIPYVFKSGTDEHGIIYAPNNEWNNVFYEGIKGLILSKKQQQLGLFQVSVGEKITVDEAFDLIKKDYERFITNDN